jgi:ribosomal protein S18 acetylase RimI-like enzyme
MKRIDEQDWEQRRQLLADGWREIEVLETWRGKKEVQQLCRLAKWGDVPALLRITRNEFKSDRLHSDPAVSDAEADEFKEMCLLQAMQEASSYVYVYGERPVGFLVVRPEDYKLCIKMIAVDSKQRERGVARALVEFATRELSFCTAIEAGTQMNNESARSFYKSLGMSVVSMERTFHR